LRRVEERKIVFVTSWGKTVSLNRDEVSASCMPNDSLTLLHDDFDAPLKTWRLAEIDLNSGEGVHSANPSFAPATVRATRLSQWQPALGDGAIRHSFAL